MPPLAITETDKRVLKEDYCNYDLIARCWNDEYRGRVWKNKERIADFEGSDLDEIMVELRAIVDALQSEKRKQRGKKKPSAREIADAITEVESKLSRAQKMMLALHSKAPGQRISVKAISRVGDYSSPERAFFDYAEVARRVCDELAYSPGSRKKDHYQGSALFFEEDLVVGEVTADTVISLRADITKALEILRW
jgi:hypothetical protein